MPLPSFMLHSRDAERLALKFAARGETVVYHCRDMWSAHWHSRRLWRMAGRLHWFSFWVKNDWLKRTLQIENRRSNGNIYFVVGHTWSVATEVSLEVQA